jgi:hypothetical protein
MRARDSMTSDPDAEVGRALVDEVLAHAELARVDLRELVQGMLPRSSPEVDCRERSGRSPSERRCLARLSSAGRQSDRLVVGR